MMKKAFFLILLMFTNLMFAKENPDNHKGAISGTIRDEATGETIPGAYVFLLNTEHKTATDLDGKYTFHGLEHGHYEILVKFEGYNEKVVAVDVLTNEIEIVDINIAEKTTEIETVVIKARPKKELGLELEKKNNIAVSDGLSAAVIQKSPDRTVGDALKRVSGASIQDNKFAIIRGLNDRYNAAYLNGAPLPSSESDRKAFSFDIFPVNMLENLTILKTATPDLPGEFGGGIINIKTKDIPENNFQSVTFGAGYNTITTFKDRLNYKGGKFDWIGIDDGSRALPSSIPTHDLFPTTPAGQAALAKNFTTDWSLNTNKFMPNFNLQYSAGVVDTLFGKEVGFIGGVSYNRTNNYNTTVRRSYTNNGSSSKMEFDYLDHNYTTQTLAGAMANFTIKLNSHQVISFKNLYSINTNDQLINRTGTVDPLETNPTMIRSNARWFTSNNIYSGQLIGEHMSKNKRMRFDWVAGYSNINRTVPNLRRSIYTRLTNIDDPSNPNPMDTVFIANISSANVGPSYGGGMFFSTNKEQISSLKASFAYHLDTIAGVITEFKVGGFAQLRERTFTARQLGYTTYGGAGSSINFNQNLLYLPENEIFAPENMGLLSPGVGGFKLTDATKSTDSYNANSKLFAGFISFDNRIGKKYRLNWGARGEFFAQHLDAFRMDKSKLELNSQKFDVLPSINFIYSPTKRQNVRLSASQTLNRPEYRELAPFAFYDFTTQFVMTGNDSLKRSKITNFDARYEWYPGKNQILSGTFFFKHFENPIEQIARADVSNEISYKNAPYAINYGVELEFRTVLGSLLKSDSASFLNNLTVFTNLAVIRSKVDVSRNVGTAYNFRPLQGQSPYVLNAGIMYKDEKRQMNYTLNVNRVGQRIYILGTINQPDIWEKSRTFLDFQIAKSMLKEKLEIKLNVQNILAQDLIFYQNNYKDASTKGMKRVTNSLFTGDRDNKNGYNSSYDDLVWKTKFGQSFSFSVTYKF